MGARDKDRRELTLDELRNVPELQHDTGAGQRSDASARAARENPFREAPTMPSQRLSADTLVNQPVPDFGDPSDDPAAKRLREALARHRADLSKVAEELDISVREIYQQARQYGIRISQYT